MCGWIAVIGRHGQPFTPEGLDRAMAAIVHRGPDDSGRFQEGAVSLGFQRLAILDTSIGGHQPMASADGRFVIVFNGEIYNYRELRTELQAGGAEFRSGSDTEVLLAAYRRWGERCVDRLNGMFAFLVLDRRDGSLFGARDRLGEKPLYIWQDGQWTVLASEPRAIGATGLAALRPEWPRVVAALRERTMDHDGGTCLEGIRQLPAAHSVSIAPDGAVRTQPYWSLPAAPAADHDRGDEQWVEELSVLVTDAVRLRLRSDVPVGFTVSGGIDSSLLICEAALMSHAGLDAFTYHDAEFDERDLVASTIARTGANEHPLRSGELDFAALLPRVVAANGEPLHSLSPLANYALFGRARAAGVKVLIGGQSADEALVGYGNFETDRWLGMALHGEWRPLVSDIRASARLHGRSAARLTAQVAACALRFALGRSALFGTLRDLRERAAAPRRRHPVFGPQLWGLMSVAAEPLRSGPARLADQQRRALGTWPLPMYLRIEDRVSMAHSVEARLPFADHRIVEHGLRMPERLKFAGGVNKVALRAAAARRVPAAVASQVRKLGFPVGHTKRTAIELQRLCRELAATREFRERGIYDKAGVQALLAREVDAADVTPLFDLAQIELWVGGLALPGPVA